MLPEGRCLTHHYRDLEKAVEDLSELLEQPIDADTISSLRQKVTDKTVSSIGVLFMRYRSSSNALDRCTSRNVMRLFWRMVTKGTRRSGGSGTNPWTLTDSCCFVFVIATNILLMVNVIDCMDTPGSESDPGLGNCAA